MMSRITIHLRKQARCDEFDTTLASCHVGTAGTDSIAAPSPSRLHFRTMSAHSLTDPSVEGVAVRHGDGRHAREDDMRHAPLYMQKKCELGAMEEWFEMRPSEPARVGDDGGGEDSARNGALWLVA
jgi:hypothetical protein